MKSLQLFEILVSEHAAMLTRFLDAAISDPALADDIFQETLLVAWRRIDDFDQDRPFGRWLRGISRNLILQENRQKQRRFILLEPMALEYLDQRFHALQEQPGDDFEEKLAGLRLCLEELPIRYRQPINLHYSSKMSGREIASQLDRTVENVKKQLQRGRHLLALCLNRKLGEAS